MFRPKILLATTVAVIGLGASAAAFAGNGEHENGREIAAALRAKTSIAQAIAVAERQTGGRAMKIDVEKEKGTYLYEVKTVSKDKVADVFIDPASGQAVRTDDQDFFAKVFDRDDQEELAKLTTSSTTLAAAIGIAEQHVGGKAIEAGFDDEDDSMVFEVEVAKEGAVHKVMIDAATGNVLNVAPTESGEQHED